MPAIGAVGILEAHFHFKRIAVAKGLIPFFDAGLQFVGMHRAFPAVIFALIETHAAEIAPALVVVVVVAVWLGGPDDLGHGVGEEAVLISALAQAVVGAGQFFGALEDAELQIVVVAAELI